MGSGSVLGGKNSVLNNPSQILGGSNSFARNPGQIWDPFKPNIPKAPPPPPAPPDQGSIRQNEVNSQLKDEVIARTQRTLFTGGSGLLDQPTTASRVLLGS